MNNQTIHRFCQSRIRKLARYAPIPSLIIFLFALLTAIMHIVLTSSETFSDFFNRYISGAIRGLFASITNPLPFSLAETFVMALPIMVLILFRVCIKVASKNWRHTIRYIIGMLSIIVLFYIMFVWTFVGGYSSSELDKKLNLERKDVSAEELAYTAEQILLDMEEVLDDIEFKFASSSIMPYSYKELNEKLNDAYEVISAEYDFIQPLRSNFKTIVLSEPMTYTHISGVYSFFTGEANVNINYPEYIIPYTAAHELAHQRGIARENEANFVAFIVCMASDDPYIRYSALLSMYEYVSSALYKASPEYYYSTVSQLDMRVRYEMAAYSEFFDKYRESKASEITGVVNNTYLIIQGTEGTKSYGMVVDLAVSYYMSKE